MHEGLVILEVLGVLVFLFALALVWLYKFPIKRRYLYRLAASINRFPSRIRLLHQVAFRWKKPDRATQRVIQFREAGFEDIGGFHVDELSCSRIFVLQHPISGLVGMVFESEELGTWSDVLCFIQNESQPVLSSSILKRYHFRFLPGNPKLHKPEASIAEMSEAVNIAAAHLAHRCLITLETFAALYEQAFADAADVRLLEPFEDFEIKRLILEGGQPCMNEVSEKEFAQLKKLLPLTIENELRFACGAQFLRETKMSATEWQKATQRLLVIHDRTSLPRLAGKLIYGVFLTKEIRRRLKQTKQSTPPRAAFDDLNTKLPAWARYKKIGTVTRPIPADIYCAPIEYSIT